MQKLLKKYNSSVEILRQNGYDKFVDLTWEQASDVSGSIYSVNIPNEDDIPLSVKRTAVDAVNLMKRLSEEEQHLVNEMDNCIHAFFGACLEREEKINCLRMSDDFGDDDIKKGLYSFQKNELHDDRINLRVACNLFREFISIPDDAVIYVEQLFQLDDDVEEIVDSEDDVEDDAEGDDSIHRVYTVDREEDEV